MYPANELRERTSRQERETVPGSVRVPMPASSAVRRFGEGKTYFNTVEGGKLKIYVSLYISVPMTSKLSFLLLIVTAWKYC